MTAAMTYTVVALASAGQAPLPLAWVAPRGQAAAAPSTYRSNSTTSPAEVHSSTTAHVTPTRVSSGSTSSSVPFPPRTTMSNTCPRNSSSSPPCAATRVADPPSSWTASPARGGDTMTAAIAGAVVDRSVRSYPARDAAVTRKGTLASM